MECKGRLMQLVDRSDFPKEIKENYKALLRKMKKYWDENQTPLILTNDEKTFLKAFLGSLSHETIVETLIPLLGKMKVE